MSDTVFTKVDYDLNSLLKYIELGEIGLPDIQRPFVWRNSKVRDLFDSMYRGYPVGYLLLWKNGAAADKTIGLDSKQKNPSLVIVDGQQRLTSLYAVIKGVMVVRDNYKNERIFIAFNPLEQRFEVADVAIRRDKTFIPDISRVLNGDASIFKVHDEYVAGLQAIHDMSDQERSVIQNSIERLHSLLTFPFTALELAADISEEDVSDVFVRINSKGTTLNQADFILTLMSVFWDEGRAALERFCRATRTPVKGGTSPFNHLIEPDPDQLLRVNVGVGFKRARLQHVYSILRGKDLETGQFSDNRRVEQFEVLKKAQAETLNVQYWHDFLSCIRLAGFRSRRMISSNNNLLFSYVLYLIGRTEFGVEEPRLRKAIGQWFFMSAVTGRFTGSPETAMEFDLAGLRDATDADQFVNRLHRVCEVTLTPDFWNVTLPNDLATSSPKSPSLFAYHAALVLLDAPVLFSPAKVAEQLDPAIHAKRPMIERYHLFPKGYLATKGISETRETNQIANYAYVEWTDKVKIADNEPEKYVPELMPRFKANELARMYHYHALPKDWEMMEYRAFLEKRRELMAQVVKQGYSSLTSPVAPDPTIDEFDLTTIIDHGESDAVEFKSTLRINLHTGTVDKRMEYAVLKTVAGFLNASGGTLFVGISDDGTAVGIDADKFPNEDKMNLHFMNIVKTRLGAGALTAIHVHFDDFEDCRVMIVRCLRAPTPVYVKDGEAEHFYVRTGPSTTELKPSEMHSYLTHRFK